MSAWCGRCGAKRAAGCLGVAWVGVVWMLGSCAAACVRCGLPVARPTTCTLEPAGQAVEHSAELAPVACTFYTCIVQGLLQRAPAEVAPGEDFSQTLCFSEEAMQETAAVARRRAAADARMPAMQRTGGGSSRATAAGSLPGAPLGVEGVEEWAQQQERVVLYNQGMYVAFPPDAAAPLPATARPITALVVA